MVAWRYGISLPVFNSISPRTHVLLSILIDNKAHLYQKD